MKMKALSFRQPRAAQIVRGEKTVDLRTWQIDYRGDLAVHASSKRRDARCRQLGFDPHALAYGALIGVVELVEIEALDQARYEALRDAHRSKAPFPGSPCYAWHLANPRPLAAPLPRRGRTRLFHVELDAGQDQTLPRPEAGTLPRTEAGTPPPPPASRRASYRVTPPPEPDPAHPFVLYAIPEEGEGYRIALYQWIQRNGEQDRRAPGAMWNAELGGDALRAVADHVLHALRVNDYKATDLAPGSGREAPFYLDELSGIRLALIMLAVKPLRRHDRIETIGHGVQAMGDEEAYYWFSKCTGGPEAVRARKALRVLLAEA